MEVLTSLARRRTATPRWARNQAGTTQQLLSGWLAYSAPPCVAFFAGEQVKLYQAVAEIDRWMCICYGGRQWHFYVTRNEPSMPMSHRRAFGENLEALQCSFLSMDCHTNANVTPALALLSFDAMSCSHAFRTSFCQCTSSS